MKPSVGRIVHYVSYGTPGGEYTSQCRAAIITEITECYAHTKCVGLFVANPTGLFLNQHTPHNETSEQRAGTWHWPERVE
jgi:hypothetical protein